MRGISGLFLILIEQVDFAPQVWGSLHSLERDTIPQSCRDQPELQQHLALDLAGEVRQEVAAQVFAVFLLL